MNFPFSATIVSLPLQVIGKGVDEGLRTFVRRWGGGAFHACELALEDID